MLGWGVGVKIRDFFWRWCPKKKSVATSWLKPYISRQHFPVYFCLYSPAYFSPIFPSVFFAYISQRNFGWHRVTQDPRVPFWALRVTFFSIKPLSRGGLWNPCSNRWKKLLILKYWTFRSLEICIIFVKWILETAQIAQNCSQNED